MTKSGPHQRLRVHTSGNWRHTLYLAFEHNETPRTCLFYVALRRFRIKSVTNPYIRWGILRRHGGTEQHARVRVRGSWPARRAAAAGSARQISWQGRARRREPGSIQFLYNLEGCSLDCIRFLYCVILFYILCIWFSCVWSCLYIVVNGFIMFCILFHTMLYGFILIYTGLYDFTCIFEFRKLYVL